MRNFKEQNFRQGNPFNSNDFLFTLPSMLGGSPVSQAENKKVTSQRHAFALDLVHPGFRTILRLVTFVVLVEGAADELPINVAL